MSCVISTVQYSTKHLNNERKFRKIFDNLSLSQYCCCKTGATKEYTVKKEIKCSGDSEILHELVHDATRKSEKNELIRVVS